MVPFNKCLFCLEAQDVHEVHSCYKGLLSAGTRYENIIIIDEFYFKKEFDKGSYIDKVYPDFIRPIYHLVGRVWKLGIPE